MSGVFVTLGYAPTPDAACPSAPRAYPPTPRPPLTRPLLGYCEYTSFTVVAGGGAAWRAFAAYIQRARTPHSPAQHVPAQNSSKSAPMLSSATAIPAAGAVCGRHVCLCLLFTHSRFAPSPVKSGAVTAGPNRADDTPLPPDPTAQSYPTSQLNEILFGIGCPGVSMKTLNK